jgi:TonB family protein
MLAIGLSMLLAVTPATTSTTVAQACTQSDTTPIVSYEPPTPALVTSSGAHGSTQLIVTLDAAGAPTNVQVVSSSGILFLDQAALKQAQRSTFEPEMRDCSAVGGSYFYTVEY